MQIHGRAGGVWGGDVKALGKYISQLDITSERIAHLLLLDLCLKGQEQPTVSLTGGGEINWDSSNVSFKGAESA